METERRVEERAGGWFVIYSDGSAGGPWKTKLAAELAANGQYSDAAKVERDERIIRG